MRKLQLHVLDRDIDAVLEHLGRRECLQLDNTAAIAALKQPAGDPVQPASEAHDGADDGLLLRKLIEARTFLGMEPRSAGPDGAAEKSDKETRATGTHATGGRAVLRRATPADRARAREMCALVEGLVGKQREIDARANQLRNTMEEVSAFSRLSVPFDHLEHLSFITLRFGSLPRERIAQAQAKLGDRALLMPIDDSGRIVAASSRKGRFALDSELKNVGFTSIGLPSDATGIPKELALALTNEQAELLEAARRIDALRNELAASVGREISELRTVFAVEEIIDNARDALFHTRGLYRITGWMPQSAVKQTAAELSELTENRIAIRLFKPAELLSVRDGSERVPVRLSHSGLVHSFENMVFSYGAPLYGTIDPTPIVAFLFILLFAIMFGDVGQGLVGVLFGLLLTRGGRFLGEDRFRSWGKFGPIFIAVGSACTLTGILYGSVFSNETLLIPFTRAVSSLYGPPQDRFISLLPEGGLGKIFVFFGFTLGLGAFINSLGLVINIYNQLRIGRYYQALFTKTGIAGALFFWYAVSLAVRAVLGHPIVGVDLAILAIPVLLVFCGEPIYRLISRQKPVFSEGPASFLMEGFVGILESVSYYLSNSLSFLRVAAFALSHTVLSLIVFRMVDLLHGSAGDLFFQTLVIIVGNLLIIFLEGLIVSIQVIRLQYYEFFSKFFTETGERFHPFVLRTT